MPVYFEYAMKASLCLAIIFLFYALLLKQMTYYTWNRYFLLFFSILSFIVPFINLNVFLQPQQLDNLPIVSQIPSIYSNKIPLNFVGNSDVFNYGQVLPAVYILVSFILFLRLFVQLLSIGKIKSKAALIIDGEVKIYHLAKPVLPFSFLNSIFINQDNYSENELQEIIEHERVHVREKHTIDVLITEIICILNWYNPFAWFIKKAVRENLEFIADNAVIRKGINRKNYQYLLLKVTGNIPSSITNNLKFSSLKNRIFMMNKTKTSRFHLLKFALLVPIIMLLLFAFGSTKEIKHTVKTEEAENYTLSTLTYSIPDSKAKAIVLKEDDKCLLKPGQQLNLKLIYNEKDRLKSLLERNGYNNLKSNAIMFWIDTISVKNSFSIEIHINVEPAVVSSINRKPILFNSQIIMTDKHPIYPGILSKANINSFFAANIQSGQVSKFLLS